MRLMTLLLISVGLFSCSEVRTAGIEDEGTEEGKRVEGELNDVSIEEKKIDNEELITESRPQPETVLSIKEVETPEASTETLDAEIEESEHLDEVIDWHNVYDNLLKKYVSEKGIVDYEGLSAEKSQLEAYLNFLSNNSPSSSWERNTRLVYWINLYNAATLDLILDNYPISSIMKINGGKAWDLKIVRVGDELLSLNEVEHEKIRPVFNEPRIHFAVNCAALSCPKLLNAAFAPRILEKQLEDQTKYFVNDAANNTISEKKISLSKIFEWYKEDFEKEGSLIDFVRKYSSTAITEKPNLNYLEYKWELNGK